MISIPDTMQWLHRHQDGVCISVALKRKCSILRNLRHWLQWNFPFCRISMKRCRKNCQNYMFPFQWMSVCESEYFSSFDVIFPPVFLPFCPAVHTIHGSASLKPPPSRVHVRSTRHIRDLPTWAAPDYPGSNPSFVLKERFRRAVRPAPNGGVMGAVGHTSNFQ